MPVEQLEGVLQAIAQMQSTWGDATDLATMRSDLENLYASFAGVQGSQVETRLCGNVAVDFVAAPGVDPSKLILLSHGGGFSMGSALSHRHLAQWISSITRCQVLLPDYRLVPEFVYPAQLQDVRVVYDWLLNQGRDPSAIALMGDSAGGGLTLSLLADLRDSGVQLPACACLMSPWLDLECRGESYRALAALDPVATHEMAVGMGHSYVGPDGDVTDPMASPIHLDFTGLPPLLIQAGTHEIFLDDAKSVANAAREAGVFVEFKQWQGMIHQWHLYAAVLDEACAAIDEQSRFLVRFLR